MQNFFKENSIVLFQGDSVTDCGRSRDNDCTTIAAMGSGYPSTFKQIYDLLFPCHTVKFVNRGISGNKICDLLDRYDEDFKEVNPDFISLMIGINDTWHGFDEGANTPPDKFEKNYEKLLEQIKLDLPDTKILIIEQFMLVDHPDRASWEDDVAKKRSSVRKLAKKYADYFIPMYDIINDAAKSKFDLYDLSLDGVHPAPQGHALIASEILKTLKIVD